MHTNEVAGPPERGTLRVLVLEILSLLFVTGLVLCGGLHWAPEPIGSRSNLFLEGTRVTIYLTLGAGGVGLVLGVLAGLARIHANRVVRALAFVYVSFFQGVPLMVQILFAYYGVPSLFPELRMGEMSASLLALALNVGAYNAETVRAGVLAVPKGQFEAARSLGLSQLQSLRWVILPQAVRVMIPPLMNNIASLFKDSAMVSTIGLLELTLVGNRMISETFRPVPALITVALVYLTLTTSSIIAAQRLEKHLRQV